MIAKVLGSVASFSGSAAYCLHDRAEEGEPRPETAERVEWTDTRNLPTSRADRATAVMAATAESAPELKRLAGVPLTGRKLQKPAYHFTLNWAKDETPGRQEMSRAVDESMKALGLEKHQALIVAHNDRAHAHVHVLVNRVSMDTGKAANLVRDRLTLSKWAEDYERRQGRIRCEKRVKNNAERRRGEWVRHRGSLPTGRYRRERMNPEREPRPEPIPPATEPAAQQKVAWQRAEERVEWEQLQRERRWLLEDLAHRCGREWSEVYARQGQQREQLAKDWRGVWGRRRQWKQAGGRWKELGAYLRGRPEVLRRELAALERSHRAERAQLAVVHGTAAREIEQGRASIYRRELEGSERRADRAASGRADGWGPYGAPYGERDWERVKQMREYVDEARWDQVRETQGEAGVQRQKQTEAVAVALAERRAAERAAAQAERERRAAAERAAELAKWRDRDRGRDFGPSR